MEKSDNQQSQIDNFQHILDNKNAELGMKEDTIKQQKKELRKQKFLKFLGLGGSVILPIIAILSIGIYARPLINFRCWNVKLTTVQW